MDKPLNHPDKKTSKMPNVSKTIIVPEGQSQVQYLRELYNQGMIDPTFEPIIIFPDLDQWAKEHGIK